MSDYTVSREYPYPVEEVWYVLTHTDQVARWTTTGRGGRPEEFTPEVGRRFRLVGKPTVGWAGVVHCEVLEVHPPDLLRYSWKGDEHTDAVTEVTYRLEPTAGGTRFTWTHSGFTGPGGFAMSRLLGRVRRRMLADGVPPVLAEYHATSPRRDTAGPGVTDPALSTGLQARPDPPDFWDGRARRQAVDCRR